VDSAVVIVLTLIALGAAALLVAALLQEKR
jgi:hypothetical protein